MIRCQLCRLLFNEITWGHLKYCHDGMTMYEYQARFPNALLRSPETSERHVQAILGSTASAATKLKMSEASRAYWDSLTAEQRRKVSRNHRCTPNPEALSKALTEYCGGLSPKELEKRCRPMHAYVRVGFRHSEHSKRLCSESMKEHWRNPGFAYRQLERMRRKPNKTELALLELLEVAFPDEWKYVGDGQVWMGGRNPDFTCSSRKAVVELFGSYWHDSAYFPNRPTEAELVAHYAQHGYKCFVIWAFDSNISDAWPDLEDEIGAWWETEDSHAVLSQ